jgi:probable rRNA maturation factor
VRAAQKITVRNLQRKIVVDVVDLQRFAVEALQLCLKIRRKQVTNLAKLPEIFILLVGNRRMSSLHRQFLGESGPTDVLSFQHGEIFVSADLARDQARQFGNSFEREIRLYIVHGLLHLHGFDDRNEIGARKMRAMQAKILAIATSR